MYYPCSAGLHAVAGESKIGRAEDHSGKEEMKKCQACLKGLEIETPVGRREICPFCGSDLHCCLNCVHHYIGAYNDCREPQAERVIEKNRSNFCDFFVFRDAETNGKGKVSGESKKLKIESLFKTG
jgi:hypothetical protein